MEANKSGLNIKTYIMYATIALLVIGAVIAIFMIFFGAEVTLLQCLATIAILYLMALLSGSNFSRSNSSQYSEARACSNLALVLNLFWGLPWIMLVWGIFGEDEVLLGTVWRFMWTFLTLALYFTLIASQVPVIRFYQDKLYVVKQAIPAFLFTYIAINVIVYIWVVTIQNDYQAYFDSVTIIFKLIGAELILLTLQGAIPSILIRNRRKTISMQPPTPTVAPEPTPTTTAPLGEKESSSSDKTEENQS